MYKLANLEKEEYENFVKNNKYKSHFLQSYAWGQFAKAKKGLFPYYLGLKNEDNEIIASSLLLQKGYHWDIAIFILLGDLYWITLMKKLFLYLLKKL